MPTKWTWHLPGRSGWFSSQQWCNVIWRVSGLTTHTLSCNKRRTSCSAALYSASLPRIGRRAMFDTWTCGHHTYLHSHPTLGDHYIIGWLNSLKPQGVLIIMNLSHLIKQSKRTKNLTPCAYQLSLHVTPIIWPQFLPPIHPPLTAASPPSNTQTNSVHWGAFTKSLKMDVSNLF